jgi:hypothetical protein
VIFITVGVLDAKVDITSVYCYFLAGGRAWLRCKYVAFGVLKDVWHSGIFIVIKLRFLDME